jgi:hypothetical protein
MKRRAGRIVIWTKGGWTKVQGIISSPIFETEFEYTFTGQSGDYKGRGFEVKNPKVSIS